MWQEKIETPYQRWVSSKERWVSSKELFHPSDFKHFAEFLWACVDNPSDKPDEGEFRERLERDLKLEPDDQGYPDPRVRKATLLFSYFPEILKLRPDSDK